MPTAGKFLRFKFKDQELSKYFTAEDTEWGYTIVTIYGGADPAKRSEEWQHEQLKRMLGDVKDYRREYEIDWTSASGDVYYPEFSRNPERYVSPVTFDPRKPVYRGWDFGFRHPACVWFQKDDRGRCLVFREVLPDNIDSHSFRDLVMYLSGQINLKQVQRRPRAMAWVRKIEQAEWEFQGTIGRVPKPPWFPPTTSYVDYSGPECYHVTRVETEKGERNDYEILASSGIYLNVLSTRVAAREQVIRRLLLPQGEKDSSGYGMVIHPSCEVLIGGLAGGIAYALGTDRNPEPNEPAKDGYYEHVHDALGYGVINVFPVDERGKWASTSGSSEKRGSVPRGIIRSPEELARDAMEQSGDFMDDSIFDTWESAWQ